VNIGHDHYVFGNKKEIEEYKKTREANVPLKSVTILGENAPAEIKTQAQPHTAAEDEFLERPLHDTGNLLYGILSFILPIIGLITGFIFKHFKYYRNFTTCKKGAIAGLIFRAILILLFLALLVIVQL